MKERPILFSGAMVRAIEAGTKTQTRRVVKNPPEYPGVAKWVFETHPFAPSALKGTPAEGLDAAPERAVWCCEDSAGSIVDVHGDCPYGVPGDCLWVREAFSNLALPSYPECFVYRADGTHSDGDGIGCELPDGCRWMPSIHMPRKACRFVLEVVSVRVERLQEISEEDAVAEGVTIRPDAHVAAAVAEDTPGRMEFWHLWRSINGTDSWNANPWVWVVEFRKVEEERQKACGPEASRSQRPTGEPHSESADHNGGGAEA